MNDLISRRAAIKRLEEFANDDMISTEKAIGADCCIELIRVMPSTEPEIIRCKDCENWIPGYITDNDDFIPPKCGKYQQMVGHSSNDYCSLAERRTNEGSD